MILVLPKTRSVRMKMLVAMLFKRPIIVWLISLFFGIPAVCFVVSHALVFSGLLLPPPNLKSYFENPDLVCFIVNVGEALFLIISIGLLLAMKRVSLPLIAAYFTIDTLHSVSGKCLVSPYVPPSLFVIVAVNIAVVAYVWNLRRKGLLA